MGIINNQLINKQDQPHRLDTSYKLNDRVFEVRMFSKNGDSAVFKNGFEIDNKIKKENYSQILTVGKISFLKNLKRTIEQYKEYNDPTTYKQFEEANQYYISKNGNLESIRVNKNDL